VVRVVLPAQVVNVGRRHERPAKLPCCSDDALIGLLLLRQPIGLDLEVDVVRPEDTQEVVGMGAGIGRPLLHEAPAEARLEASGEGDHPFRMAVQELHVHTRLAPPESLEEAGRSELDEVPKARVRSRHQGQVIALEALCGAPTIVDQIRLQSQDRLDSVLPAGLVVLDRPVHHPVIGEPESRHTQLRRTGRQPAVRAVRVLHGDLARAIEQRVLAVNVQVNYFPAHDGIISIGPDATGSEHAPCEDSDGSNGDPALAEPEPGF
jgi:hypothetical protein